jgi:hypothetical protein
MKNFVPAIVQKIAWRYRDVAGLPTARLQPSEDGDADDEDWQGNRGCFIVDGGNLLKWI